MHDPILLRLFRGVTLVGLMLLGGFLSFVCLSSVLSRAREHTDEQVGLLGIGAVLAACGAGALLTAMIRERRRP